MAGTYKFADDMCPNEGGSALCIDRPVTIEAEVAGSVVLDAKGARRVIYVSTTGRAELVGLRITGGAAYNVSFLASTLNPYVTSHRRLDHLNFSLQGGGIFIDGSANLTDCNIHDNVANRVSFLLKSNPLRSVYGPAPRWNVASTHGWQDGYGGGLFISGTATLTDTNVYANQATSYVCSRSELLELSSSAPRALS